MVIITEKQEKVTQYINHKTGEFFEKRSYVDIMFDDDMGYVAWAKKKSVKSYMDIVLPKEFNWAEIGRIEVLKRYILKDNQFLVYRSHNTIKPMGIAQFSKVFEMSERCTKLLIKKMKKHGIIKEVSFNNQVYYSFNPIYGLKDKRITLTLFMIFQEELKNELPKWVVNKFLEQAAELETKITVLK